MGKDSEPAERLPTEALAFEEKKLFAEGRVVPVFANRYERSQKARLACIQYYGDKCYACDFHFGAVYSSIANGFIHVHHKVPLSEIQETYEVDPLKDLVPLCANCHSVIHLNKPAMNVEELKRLIKTQKRKAEE